LDQRTGPSCGRPTPPSARLHHRPLTCVIARGADSGTGVGSAGEAVPALAGCG
jgi:hypothetical protein